MANPNPVECPKDNWTKVATNVQIGNIWLLEKTRYFQTYRLTGEAAPTGKSEAIPVEGQGIPINSSVGIDVYIYTEIDDGKVRVDV